MSFTLEESRLWCHDVMRRAARNFYYGMSLLPEPKRNAMFALYAYMRHIDDIADNAADAGVDRETITAALELWRQGTHACLAGEQPPHPLFPALCDAVHRFNIPVDLLDSAIDGQLMDMQRSQYETFDELKRYCYCVASTVGIAALYIWGFHDSSAIALADDRGVAFQLTNILRDVREDYARDRVYIPHEDLKRFDVNIRLVMADGEHDPDRIRFLELIRFEAARARQFYNSSMPLEELVDHDSRPTLRIMTRIYGGILDEIESDPAAIFTRRVGLSSMAKVGEVAKELWRMQLGSDS